MTIATNNFKKITEGGEKTILLSRLIHDQYSDQGFKNSKETRTPKSDTERLVTSILSLNNSKQDQSNNNIWGLDTCLCSAIQSDGSYYERKVQKLLFHKKNITACFGNLQIKFSKKGQVRRIILEKSRNLESLFTVLIPEIKSTIRSRSCKSVMYLKANTSNNTVYKRIIKQQLS